MIQCNIWFIGNVRQHCIFSISKNYGRGESKKKTNKQPQHAKTTLSKLIKNTKITDWAEPRNSAVYSILYVNAMRQNRAVKLKGFCRNARWCRTVTKAMLRESDLESRWNKSICSCDMTAKENIRWYFLQERYHAVQTWKQIPIEMIDDTFMAYKRLYRFPSNIQRLVYTLYDVY